MLGGGGGGVGWKKEGTMDTRVSCVESASESSCSQSVIRSLVFDAALFLIGFGLKIADGKLSNNDAERLRYVTKAGADNLEY